MRIEIDPTKEIVQFSRSDGSASKIMSKQSVTAGFGEEAWSNMLARAEDTNDINVKSVNFSNLI